MKHDIGQMKTLVQQLTNEENQHLSNGHAGAARMVRAQIEALEKTIAENNHGGARPGAGRKKRPTNKRVPIQFKISELDEELLREHIQPGESINTAARRIMLQAIRSAETP